MADESGEEPRQPYHPLGGIDRDYMDPKLITGKPMGDLGRLVKERREEKSRVFIDDKSRTEVTPRTGDIDAQSGMVCYRGRWVSRSDFKVMTGFNPSGRELWRRPTEKQGG